MGDLAEWVDADDFNKGLRFAGRVAEEFKLRSGTWVAGSRLRGRLLDLCSPLVREVVICGLNREYVSALVWLNDEACEQMSEDYNPSKPWQSKLVSSFIEDKVLPYNRRNPGSSTCIKRIRFMVEPPSISMGEVSDKGSVISQRILETRGEAVNSMYAEATPDILVLTRN